MNSKTITWVLGAIAVSLAAVLAVTLTQRPQPGADPAPAPATASSSQEPTTTPSAAPTTKVTDPTAEGGPSSLPSSEVDAHDANPGATPYSQTAEARRQWEPVATGFGRAFTSTKGKNAKEWRASLAGFVTAKVRSQLTTVDLANVPAGKFAGIEAAEFGEDKVAVFIHYDNGLTLVTYLILDTNSWRIYAYDRWED